MKASAREEKNPVKFKCITINKFTIYMGNLTNVMLHYTTGINREQ